jgi:glycine cleavage system aminomethyltransferase T
MLNPEGKIVGEFSVSRVGEEEFFLFGSQAAEVHHHTDHINSSQWSVCWVSN